ncbi:MAG: secondary thiamine-phosphate synthase enzyme YjbQ [Myxococcota bacterium]|nr:secondary thiamine-phosphate synthase enzyme YjbQ [Myxococcota bacterium]
MDTELEMEQGRMVLETPGRGTIDITRRVQEAVRETGIEQGLCTVFVHHTSASLIISENADADVQRDLDTYFAKLVPDGDPMYLHSAEGPDDMPSHIRSILTQTSLNIPVRQGRCDLGTWQGIFLWEHRTAPHRRRITVSVMGPRPQRS